jgi:hypothetical protein
MCLWKLILNVKIKQFNGQNQHTPFLCSSHRRRKDHTMWKDGPLLPRHQGDARTRTMTSYMYINK